MSTDNHSLKLPGQSTDVHAGAQPFWLPGGPIGVLLIHGYGGSVGDLRPLADTLQASGLSVFGLRVAGHGLTREHLRHVTIQDWRDSVFAAGKFVRQHCDHVVVVGMSFGGALAVDYAVHTPHSTIGLVTINTALRYRGGGPFQKIAFRLLNLFSPYLKKPGTTAQDQARFAQSGSLPVWPISGLLDTYTFIERFVLPALPRVLVPALVMTTESDRYADHSSGSSMLKLLGSQQKQQVILPGHTHRPHLDPESRQLMVEKITKLVKSDLP